jgi:hypothetical protein
MRASIPALVWVSLILPAATWAVQQSDFWTAACRGGGADVLLSALAALLPHVPPPPLAATASAASKDARRCMGQTVLKGKPKKSLIRLPAAGHQRCMSQRHKWFT